MNSYIEPEFMNSALITIDLQQDTMEGHPMEIPGTSAVLPRVRILLDAYRAHKRPIVHIVRIYKPDGSNVDNCRRHLFDLGKPILVAGSEGVELAEDLFEPIRVRYNTELLLAGKVPGVTDTEVIMYKPRWGAFFGTELEDFLRKSGVTTTVFVGCNYPNCPRTSIYQASERDFKVVVAADCISGIYEKAISELNNIGVIVTNSEDIALNFSPAPYL